MYVSHIGKKFLEIYNQKNNLNLNSKEYFSDIHFRTFYDNENYLHSPGNTPLFGLIINHSTNNELARYNAKLEIINKTNSFIEKNDFMPDMSFALGYPAAGLLGTTSGQISNLKIPLNENDIYNSWIGVAFGIGIYGGFNVLFDNETILNTLYEGFSLYREYVQENSTIKNKIETWNSLWFVHRLNENFNEEYPKANFQPVSVSKKGDAVMERSTWVQVILSLSNRLSNSKLNGFVYSYGQMNKTIGFIQFNLPEVFALSELYKILFANSEILKNKNLADLYETEYSFHQVCQMGVIGLRSLEPKDLKQFMPIGKEKVLPKLKSDEKSKINYFIYQLWIIAMLNNKELLELAEKSAIRLIEFIDNDKKVRTNRLRAVEELLSTKNKKDFIEKINLILEIDKSISDIANELVYQIMTNVAPDNLVLFVTLLRFKFLTNTK